MRSIRTKTERALLGAATLALLAGCEGRVAPPIGERRDLPPQRGGTLRAAFFVDVRSLDAAVAFDTASFAVENLIYDRLVSYDEKGEIAPQLAESWDISADGKRYTFQLRRGVRFHDGEELRAGDVKRSIERALHVQTPCPVPSYYESIRGYTEYHDGKTAELAGVHVEGDWVVAIELTQIDAAFLHLMALPIVAPLCKSAGRTFERGWTSQACGAGPFKLEKYENGNLIRVVRHDGYWDKGKPYLDAIEWHLAVQSFTQRFKFERGDLDYMRDLSEADSQLYRGSPEWRGLGAWEASLSTGGSFMNTELPPFDNRHFRRAIAFATNREQIAAVRPGHVVPHTKMVPDTLIPKEPGYPGQIYDYRQALEEMRLAGYPFDPKSGKGGYPVEIPYIAILDSFAQQSGEILQQQLARIGVRIRLQVVGFPTLLAKVSRRKTVPLGWTGWHADFPDPSTFFEPVLSTKAIQEEESQNSAFFSHPEFDRVIDEARHTNDRARRLALYRRAEQIVADEAPWVISYVYRYFELWHPYVHGYQPHPVLSQNVREMWFDRGAKQRAASRRARTRSTLALALPGSLR
jgi:ABC-type transport system substrate-binding protein